MNCRECGEAFRPGGLGLTIRIVKVLRKAEGRQFWEETMRVEVRQENSDQMGLEIACFDDCICRWAAEVLAAIAERKANKGRGR